MTYEDIRECPVCEHEVAFPDAIDPRAECRHCGAQLKLEHEAEVRGEDWVDCSTVSVVTP
jgi:uncharacterized protein (DUF983 family)